MLLNFIYKDYDYVTEKNNGQLDHTHFNSVLIVNTKDKELYVHDIIDFDIKKFNYDFVKITIDEFLSMVKNLKQLGYDWIISF